MAFEAKAKAAETKRRHELWLALESAHLVRVAFHAPNKVPTLAKLLGEEPAAQTGEQRRNIMKALAVKTGGEVRKRGPE